ncbi:MAG: hypothetical protein M1823_008976, partial [Watsoniomyces obsoletus]
MRDASTMVSVSRAAVEACQSGSSTCTDLSDRSSIDVRESVTVELMVSDDFRKVQE